MPYPTPAPSQTMMPHAAAYMAHAVPPRTLLLVEDSRLAAEAVRLICRKAGIRLRRADTLESAMLHLKVYRPDIAMIDLGLPDGSGLDLIAALATRLERPGRIVAVSGDGTWEAASFAAGAQAFLLKPVTMARHLKELTGHEGQPGVDLQRMDRRLGLPVPGAAARNAGADPLALRDDLRLVRDMLQGPARLDALRYAGQFLASIGQALGDRHMAKAATQAAHSGDRALLLELAREREPVGPPL